MITNDKLEKLDKKNILQEAKNLDKSDISFLIDCLSLKEEKIRYPAVMLLEQRSLYEDDVYRYWNLFKNNLNSEDYFEKNIASTLICANVRWDKDNRFEEIIEEYFKLFYDEKPSTICMSIRNLKNVIDFKEELVDKIANKVMDIDVPMIKESMQRVALRQIIDLLIEIRKKHPVPRIEKYIEYELNGNILGDKDKKEYLKLP